MFASVKETLQFAGERKLEELQKEVKNTKILIGIVFLATLVFCAETLTIFTTMVTEINTDLIGMIFGFSFTFIAILVSEFVKSLKTILTAKTKLNIIEKSMDKVKNLEEIPDDYIANQAVKELCDQLGCTKRGKASSSKNALIIVENEIEVCCLRVLFAEQDIFASSVTPGTAVGAFKRDSDLGSKFGVIVVDLDFPEEHGRLLCKQLRILGCKIPIIGISHRENEWNDEILEHSGVDQIAKSIDDITKYFQLPNIP